MGILFEDQEIEFKDILKIIKIFENYCPDDFGFEITEVKCLNDYMNPKCKEAII